MPSVDVSSPKGPRAVGRDELGPWALRQLQVASEILDNPGGGLLFASQTMGQVRAALARAGEDRWAQAIDLLREAEDAAVHRDFATARELLSAARESLRS